MVTSVGAVSFSVGLDNAQALLALSNLTAAVQALNINILNIAIPSIVVPPVVVPPIEIPPINTAATIAGFQALADAARVTFGAIKSFAEDGVNTYKGFEASLNSFRAVSSATPEQMKALEVEAIAIGKATTKTANETAAAAVELSKLGFSAEDTTKNLRGLVAMSEASGTSVEKSASIVGAASSVYGRSASDIGNIVAATSNATAADANDFLQVVSQAGAVAKANNQDLETLAITFGLVRQAGFSASTAATAVKTVINRLSAPSTKEAGEAMKKVGVDIRDGLTGEMRDLVELVPEFKEAFKNMKPDEKASLTRIIFGDEGGPAFLALMAASESKVAEVTTKVRNANKGDTGAGAMFETQQKLMQGLGNAIEQKEGSIDTLKLMLGQSLADALTVSNTAINSLLGVFLTAPPIVQGVAAGTVGLTAATAGLITGYVLLEKLQIIKTAQEVAGAAATIAGILVTKAAAAARVIYALATTQVTAALVAQKVALILNTVTAVAFSAAQVGLAASTNIVGTSSYFAAGGLSAMATSAALALAPLALLGAAIGLIAVVQKTQEIGELNVALDDLRGKTDIVGKAGVGSAQDLGNAQRTRAKATTEKRGLTTVEKEAEKKAITRADRTLPLLEKQLVEASAVPEAKAGLFGLGKDEADAQNNARNAAIGQIKMQIDQVNRQKKSIQDSIELDKKKAIQQEKAKPTVDSVTEAIKKQSVALEEKVLKQKFAIESDLAAGKINEKEAAKRRAAIELQTATDKANLANKSVKSLGDGKKEKPEDLEKLKETQRKAQEELLKAQQEANKARVAAEEERKKKQLEDFEGRFSKKQQSIQKDTSGATLAAKQAELGGASAEATSKKIEAIQQSQAQKEIGLLNQKLAATKKLQTSGVITAKESADRQAQIEEELANKTIALVEKQIAAKKKAAIDAIEARLSEQRLPLERQANDLGVKTQDLDLSAKKQSATAGVGDAQAKLDQQRLGFQLKEAELAGNTAKQEELKSTIYEKQLQHLAESQAQQRASVGIAREQQAIELQRQEIMAQIAILEAQASLAKAEATGASSQEVAALSQSLGFRQQALGQINKVKSSQAEINALDDKKLSIEQQATRENLEQTRALEQQKAARQAAVEQIEKQLAAQKLPLEKQSSDLGFKSQDLDLQAKKQSAITGLVDSQAKLDQQRLGFQLQIADLTGDSAKQEQLKEQIYQQQLQHLAQSQEQQKANIGIARQQQEIDLRRQEITAQIAVLEAEAALAKAQATGASATEVAALSQVLSLRNQAVGQIGKVRAAQSEINNLEDKKLSVEQKVTRENLEQTRALEKQKAARQKAIEQIEEAIKKQERASKLTTTVDTIEVRQKELAGRLSAEDAAVQIEQISLRTAGREIGILKNKLAATQQLRAKGLISVKEAADREGQIQQELAQANLGLIEKQLEAKRKAALLAIEIQLAAKKLPLEGELNKLDNQKSGLDIESRKQNATTGLSSAVSDLDKQRLEFQLSLAEIANDSTKSEQIKQQIYSQQIAALAIQQQAQQQSLAISQKQQAIDLERQKIQAQIAIFEAQASLEKAKATGAAPREIASLQQVLGFREQALGQIGQAEKAQQEVNKLEQQKLNVEQLGSREKLTQQKQLDDARKIADAKKEAESKKGSATSTVESSSEFDAFGNRRAGIAPALDQTKIAKEIEDKRQQQVLTVTAQTAIIQALGAVQAEGLKGLGFDTAKPKPDAVADIKAALPITPEISTNVPTPVTDTPTVEGATNALAEAQKAMQEYTDRWNAEAVKANQADAQSYAKRKGINYNTEEGKTAAAIGVAQEATSKTGQESALELQKYLAAKPIEGAMKTFEGGQTPQSEFQRLQQQLEEAKGNRIQAQNEANKPKGLEATVTRIYEILAKNFGDIAPTNQPNLAPKIEIDAKQIKMSLEETTNNIYNLLGSIADRLVEGGKGGIGNITVVAQNPVAECAELLSAISRRR